MLLKRLLITLCFILFFVSSVQAFFIQEDFLKKDSQLPKPTDTDEHTIQKEILKILATNSSIIKIYDTRIKLPDSVITYYQERDFWPVWRFYKSPQGRLIRELTMAILDSETHAMDPYDYHWETLNKVVAQNNDFADFAKIDILMTDALLKLASDITNGRVDPQKAQPEWYLLQEPVDVLPIVKNAIEDQDIKKTIDDLYPKTDAYINLKKALAYYRSLLKKGTMPTVPKSKKKVEAGTRGAPVVALRNRLKFSGDLPPKADKHVELFDEELTQAVKAFQNKHGLNEDGVIGLYTLQALNRPLKSVISQIEMNLERLRWLTQEMPEKYIIVNIPDYQLKIMDKGKVKLAMRTVVGNKKWQTPVFDDEMETVVINPKWNVPPKILEKEMIPKIQKNPDYLKKKNFTVLQRQDGRFRQVNPDNVDWENANPKDFQISQKSGWGNALGRLKFLFPNEFIVYMHDTPAKSLFKNDFRAYSHGCIRLEHPIELAEYILEKEPAKKKWDVDRIKEAIKDGREVNVTLKEKIPVLLRYFTAWVDDEGNLNFRKDIYDYDQKLAKALKSN
ncbi:MAG: L,D-transpeptidase family protein [bacterium]|nr:L,D-transpeptidase family protein [bacterium]MBU1916609.1 L,D-transpeptidase family protein [bacterium]